SFTDEEVKSIGRFLDENGIGLVGFSIMTGHFLQSIDLMRKLKKNSKKIKFIFGGVHPTILPEECLTAGADYAVMGDGEIPLRRLLAEEPVYKIAGLCYVDNGKPVVNPADHENLIPLDKLPFPDYDFSDSYFLDKASVKQLDIKTYRDRTTWAGEYYYLTTTRGCPYHCAYCCNVNRHSLRRNTVDRVIEELNEVKENMPFICGINIQDDSFFMGSD
ncbi:MAG: cobalamin-dependent protein, partial [Candidatus Omnitrophica bacterium]|nr:cobalamin-dependent protein [Candidatus Omnitrophota bacterium]